MMAAKVGFGNAVLRAVLLTKLFLENVNAVVARYAAEAVEEDFKVGVLLKESLDKVKVKDLFKHGDVVGGCVNDFDFHRAVGLGADCCEVDIRNVGDFVRGELFGGCEDFVGNGFGSGCAIGEVVLDAKVLGRAWGRQLSLSCLRNWNVANIPPGL